MPLSEAAAIEALDRTAAAAVRRHSPAAIGARPGPEERQKAIVGYILTPYASSRPRGRRRFC